MKTKTEIVVKALLLGLEVELENRTYRLFRNGEKFNMPNHNTGYADTPWLGIRMCQEDKPVFCGAELPLCAVIQIAEKLPDPTQYCMVCLRPILDAPSISCPNGHMIHVDCAHDFLVKFDSCPWCLERIKI